MDEKIGVSKKRIKEIIKKMNDVFTTIDVIREYSGGFYVNKNTPPSYSFNAQFGKLLKRNETEFQIKEKRQKLSISDDNGKITKTSQWGKIFLVK